MKKLKRYGLGILLLLFTGTGFAYGMGYRLLQMATHSSMYPTLKQGTLFIVQMNPNHIEKGDILLIDAAFYKTNHPILKRVIGAEGDIIEERLDSIFVNQNYLKEPYVYFDEPLKKTSINKQWKVNKAEWFVLGDNRNNSEDSRHTQFGLLPSHAILGKVVFIKE